MVWERCSPNPWLLLGDTCRGRTELQSLKIFFFFFNVGINRWSCIVHQRSLTMVPVKVTGGDCQEMLKLELLVGVKLVEPEPAELLVLDGMDTGAVALGERSRVKAALFSASRQLKQYLRNYFLLLSLTTIFYWSSPDLLSHVLPFHVFYLMLGLKLN